MIAANSPNYPAHFAAMRAAIGQKPKPAIAIQWDAANWHERRLLALVARIPAPDTAANKSWANLSDETQIQIKARAASMREWLSRMLEG